MHLPRLLPLYLLANLSGAVVPASTCYGIIPTASLLAAPARSAVGAGKAAHPISRVVVGSSGSAPQGRSGWVEVDRRSGARLILVVEDEFDLCDLVATVLEFDGNVETTRARDGERALEIARTMGPGLVILDVRPPRLRGLAVARRLKADKVTRAIPLVALTSEPATRAISSACDYCVTRPYDLLKLVEGLMDHAAVAA